MQLLDKVAVNDLNSLCKNKSSLKTKIVVKCKETGEVLWTGHNKLVIAGAGFLARAMFDIDTPEITVSYNTALNLDNTISGVTVTDNRMKTCLFCVGTNGCGRENSQVYDVDYTKWIDPDSIVPFQYMPIVKDIKAVQRSIYFGKKTTAENHIYYFKSFDSDPQLIQQYTDGTLVDATVYTNNTTMEAETYVAMTMSIDKFDCRDYFIATTGIKDARINTISLCTAWYRVIDGYRYYQDIRPITRLNFPNESLIDLRKGIDIEYYVYF